MDVLTGPRLIGRWITHEAPPEADSPLRAELFGLEQLARHGRLLAASHVAAAAPPGRRTDALLSRLGDNEDVLRTFARNARVVEGEGGPASEWLLDNFYLIEEQIQMARRHLPRGYGRELPRLSEGPFAGLPRVYDLMLELIAHLDGQIDGESLRVFLRAYEGASSLQLGELWAVPIMLRLGLIENLRRVAARLARARYDRAVAVTWIDRLQDMTDHSPSKLVIVVAEMAKSDLPLSGAFTAEFARRLTRKNPMLHMARGWLEQRLAEHGLSIEQLVHQESQEQAADQVTVSHAVTSLRFLSSMDWKEFVEDLSAVDRVLREDPPGIYARMDFTTRDQYRHAVEAFARHGARGETEIARFAVDLAGDAAGRLGTAHREAHVGYYLIDRGRAQIEAIVAPQWPPRARVERAVHRHPMAFYAGGITALTLLCTAAFSGWGWARGMEARTLLWLLLPVALGASQMAVGFLNVLARLAVPPRLLPRLDYSGGIPPESRSMVVIPTMLSDADAVDGLLERLEIHYLANRDGRLHFALLTDFRDAARETMPEDEGLLARARKGVEILNARYADGDHLFFLLHRPRRWNPAEGLWMGHERKRGKLMDFNALLRGRAHGKDCFAEIRGDLSILPEVRYVITLDTDTRMPRDAARQLAGIMAHPLNRPVFDGKRGIVRDGYGVLQPRLGVSLPSAGPSWFVRLFAGDAGIDPYTRAVSDVYQDVFGEGSFVGKGIYDVEAFERALADRFPENTVLSHDLLEASHARSALVSDVEFYEEHPSRYNVDVARRHRWIRGDWQITQWLLPRVRGAGSRRRRNPLSALSRWKIFDNLRRSLVSPALLALLFAGWLLPALPAWTGPLLVLFFLAGPGLLSALVDLFSKPRDLPPAMHLQGAVDAYARQLGQIVLAFAFLPYDAFISLDAVARTALRMLVTHRRLLEWRTSLDAERLLRPNLRAFVRAMWVAPACALGVGAVLVWRIPAHVPAALAFLALWMASPWIAWYISQVPDAPPAALSGTQVDFLRRIARKTWGFFETFVTAEENHLPPDNYQENLSSPVAPRTSPTNIGMALLANLAARDLGHATTGALLRRTRDTFDTLHKLERYHGHFYNWYDTRTLQPLAPRYVSSVDSGNLAGHLLVLGAGLREIGSDRIFGSRIFQGLRDTLSLLREHEDRSRDEDWERLDASLAQPPADAREACALLENVEKMAVEASRRAASSASPANLPEGIAERARWADALARNARDHRDEILLLAPWLGMSAEDAAAQVSALGWDPASAARLADAREMLPTLVELAELAGFAGGTVAQDSPPLVPLLLEAAGRARARLGELESLARRCDDLAASMDFSFLFDPARNLFSIGFNVVDRRKDASFYDLLASEARLGSYVAIALGQVPQDHWFSLGRLLVSLRNEPILASWSGSMFEYLMPGLVMPAHGETLLDHTCRAAVRRQMEYGASRGVPWGISESAYNRTDVHLNYQYRAFGVPGLGLKRGLAEDLVIAPYASMLALIVAPREACENLQRLSAEGLEGAHGFYDAVDYTPSRLPPDQTSVTINSYMAHHQGMGLLALLQVLEGGPMQRRFLACPILRASELLLQERVPRAAASVLPDEFELDTARPEPAESAGTLRIFRDPSARAPKVHLLSNGRYHVAVTSGGGGYSRWGDLAVTRWREDATRDNWGAFLYLRDTATGEFWSAAHQPSLRATRHYEAVFTQGRAEFRHRHAGLDVHTEISVSPEDDVEIRRVTLTNRSHGTRTVELTSYAEVSLATPAEDAAHPAFGNLFVRTEFAPSAGAVLATRRPRSEGETPPWMLHAISGQGGAQGDVSCETDRGRFLGRGGSPVRPAALQRPGALSNTAGPVLDPSVSLRRCVSIASGESATVVFILGVAETRLAALALADKYQNARMVDRAFDLAWTHSQVVLRQLDAQESEVRLYGQLAGALIYVDPARRPDSAALLHNRRGQSGLWGYGISGDLPIVVLHVRAAERLELVRQLVRAHAYWRLKGLATELVILIEDVSVYRQELHEEIAALIASGVGAQALDKAGGIFVRRMEQVPPEDRNLLLAIARVVLDDQNGTLGEQLDHAGPPETLPPALQPARIPFAYPSAPLPPRDGIFSNGLGAFTRDGHEYVITLPEGAATPAPWVNVIANARIGTVVSESGAAYTWGENAHEFRLTPWNNDPVQDAAGEAFYLRDEHTGQFWSPTPLPARGMTPYVSRHGFGYSVFEHTEHGIASELWVYVAVDAPVKFAVLKVRNVSGRPRRVSATGYWEWVLGDLRNKTLLHVQTDADLPSGALLARNPYNTEFPERVAFADVNDPARALTGSRAEFLGRNGTPAQPAAMRRTRLSGRTGAGLDPCGALQSVFDLREGQEKEVVFRIGVGRDLEEARDLIRRFRAPEAARGALEEVWSHWNRVLGAVNVDTPDDSVNVLVNGWLPYQVLACRVLGRSGFYQSGGAYGFRDQLQDVMALVHAEPALVRTHLLRAAAHQFREGDVQHWWHPPAGRGVRTRFSDDFLWLPYAACRYVRCVGDTGVMDERVAFLEGRPVRADEEAYYDLPVTSRDTGTLYEHCVRAIEHGLRFGAHGLPLMGCGDWNDGMNRVGIEGRGESVWLAFFLCDVLAQFGELAAARGDAAFAARCREERARLGENIEAHAWDGGWYKRAFFDDGAPLGSHVNPECQIDSLPQSWAVLSGAADPERARRALDAVNERLVRRDDGLILLFDPPFDRSRLDPGYIKGYIPGVRENGGQYTHAAVWAAMAAALAGEVDRAWELFGLINPVRHTDTAAGVALYRAEPYVVAADVYGRAPHTGRGGWTWYTGAAGWMYRLLVETLLGLHLEAGGWLRLAPRMPRAWDGFKIHYRHRTTTYHISIVRAEDRPGLSLDGQPQADSVIPLTDDGHEHFAELRVLREDLGSKPE